MSNVERTPSENANLALAAYLEPVLRGQRVLLVDALDDSLPANLAAKADVVQVVAPDELAILGSHATAELDLAFDADAFDVIWVADVAELEEPRARAVDAFRNALAQDGILVMVVDAVESETRPRRRRPRDPGEALGRLAAAAFEDVMVLVQSTFEGFSLDALEGAEADTGLDQSLTVDEPPTPGRYIALASERLPNLESRLVVRTPALSPMAVPSGVDPEVLREAEARAEEFADEAERLRAEVVELEDALAAERTKLARLQDECDKADRLLDEAELVVKAERAEKKQANQRARDLDASLQELRRQSVDPEEIAALRDEVGVLETRLAETAQKLLEADAEAERRAVVARDLLVELQAARPLTQSVSAPGVPGEAQVDALAEREAALYASDELRAELAQVRKDAAARIEELERELAAAEHAVPAHEPVEIDLSRAHKPGSELIPRDTERVRAMGAELLTYRQHAGERDQLAADLERCRKEAQEARAFAQGLRLRVEEAERALASSKRAAPAQGDAGLHAALRRVDALELELRELERTGAEYDAIRAERDALLEQRATFQQRLEDLEQALREADDEVEELREERDQARAGLAEARAALQQVASQQDLPG